MFRVELAYDTIKTEIEHLESKAKRREKALKEGIEDLAKDKKRTMDYVKMQKQKKKDMEEDEKEQYKVK